MAFEYKSCDIHVVTSLCQKIYIATFKYKIPSPENRNPTEILSQNYKCECKIIYLTPGKNWGKTMETKIESTVIMFSLDCPKLPGCYFDCEIDDNDENRECPQFGTKECPLTPLFCHGCEHHPTGPICHYSDDPLFDYNATDEENAKQFGADWNK